ncbi:M18 family aminopeptidase [Corynebacterium ammoniagenes]|nr:M18 family aminopeptidase [Corynebacterium ammoniagenes]APT82628.1 aminopeptidase 2 [Corynebacterium ammoniagenes DSM 20306]AQS73696.1 M18 family aminopeptidase [Corynebacterium ammoniagenes]EFG82361.1 aminopeptidase I zinc metalloprotease (M18) [Corynebacterium ammoniagenes DSM 20306]
MENSIADFIDFIEQSPSSYHAAENVASRLEEAGFDRVDETQQWPATPGGHVMVRGGAVMAWFVPENFTGGFKIIGSHTDSPGFMVKPNPDFHNVGWSQLAVEVYGGPILHTWFDRELKLAGQVVLKDGTRRLVDTGALVRIPNLAIHLYREKNFDPDRQVHVQPIVALEEDEVSFAQVLAENLNVDAAEISSYNLVTVDAQRGEVFGAGHKFVAAGRMDNLSSVWASLKAMLAAVENYSGNDVLVLSAFDHEEVGSSSRYGAAGPILEDVLTRTAGALGKNQEERRQIYARSSCVSADAAHSVHPNYVGKHDPTHHPLIGKGPVTKINANQRYASDAASIHLWESACERANVPVQRFVGNNAVPCGSTIGPITATRLGIDTVDVGVPLLSMHSARELVGVQDQLWMIDALEAYLVG